MSDQSKHAREFTKQASAGRTGLVREFIDFLRYNKKWWMVPILVTFAVLGVFVALTSTGLGPFMYTLF